MQVHIYEGGSGRRTQVDQLDMGSISSQASSSEKHDRQHPQEHGPPSELVVNGGGREVWSAGGQGSGLPRGSSVDGGKMYPYLEDLSENEETSDMDSEEHFMNTQL